MLDILGLIIGMVFAFLLLSLLATMLQEIISSLLSMRGKFLLDALVQLLELDWVDDSELAGTPEGEKVNALNKKRKEKRDEWIEKIKTTRVYQKYVHVNAGIKRLPSYLSGDQVIAILQELLARGDDDEGEPEESAPVAKRARGAGAPKLKVSKVEPLEGEDADVEEEEPQRIRQTSAYKIKGETLECKNMNQLKLRDNLYALKSMTEMQKAAPPPDLSQTRMAARGIIDDVSPRFEKIKKEITDDFNDMMDRTAGWYKKRVQTVLFMIGLTVAIVLNADTFAMYDALSNNPEARKEVLAIAEDFVNNSTFYDYQDTTATAQTTPADMQTVTELRNKVSVLLAEEVDGVGSALGFGWSDLPENLADAKWWIFKLLGWLVTALAVSLGATFWFDILKQLINIRNSGVRPSTATDQAKE